MEEKYTEILRLKEMLEKEGIPFVFKPQFDGYTIKYDDSTCSIIEHTGSFGEEKNLLEIMGLLTKKERADNIVLGYLTAEDVFKRIQKHYKNAPYREGRTRLKEGVKVVAPQL